LKENDRLQAWLVLRSTWMKMIVTSWILVRQNGSDFCQSLTGETIRTKCLHWGEVDHIQPLALEVDRKKVMILFNRLHWRSIHREEKMILFSRLHWRSIGKRWSYSAVRTEGRSLRKKMILFSRLHWRSIGKRWSYSTAYAEGRYLSKKVILFSRLHWRSIRKRWSYSTAYVEGQSLRRKGDLIQPLTLKVDTWGRRWSYSASCTEGQSLRKKDVWPITTKWALVKS